MPNCHVGQVQVAHQVMLTAGAVILALVDVVDEAFLDIGQTVAERVGYHYHDHQDG